MPAAFLLFLQRIIQVAWWCVRYPLADSVIGQLKRLLALFIGMPLLVALQFLHWLGFVLDELLFPGYRRITVDSPVFIVGIPRSGTTLLQRTLSVDERFTCMRAWECLLAPSISERYVCLALARLFSPLASRLAGSARWQRLQAIHPTGLQEPEEDFLVLLPVLSCFLLLLIFPQAQPLRRLGFFDRDVPSREKRIILGFYRRCVQKHLYFHGHEQRYLAKNPSFTPMLASLTECFPDARFIGCTRAPVEAVPSQLSALRPALELCGFSRIPTRLRDFMLDKLHFDYDTMNEVLIGRFAAPVVTLQALKENLYATMVKIYRYLDEPMNPALQARLQHHIDRARQYSSCHHYYLEEFCLDEDMIRQRFADVWPENMGGESVKQTG